MKLLDKLKNALFEEEYVEVEEKKEVKKKEKPIAKKIIVDEPKPKKQTPKEDLIIEEEKNESQKETPNRDFKFKAILDDDFIDLEEEKKEKPQPKKEPKVEPKPVIKEPKVERKVYKTEKKKEESNPYKSLDNEIKIHEYGAASKQRERKTFHPSPIISPIYGVLDQNYKKDDIVTKKEVRITSSYKSKNIDVDSVREKAYGNSDDIFEEELISNKQKDKEIDEKEDDFIPEESIDIKEEDSLLDISSDNTPSVAKVTMGDAEEYYSDLGLEYNIDYKDVSHEKATGRRTDLKKFDEEEPKQDDASIEENLFDLIDSMYDEKKGE